MDEWFGLGDECTNNKETQQHYQYTGKDLSPVQRMIPKATTTTTTMWDRPLQHTFLTKSLAYVQQHDFTDFMIVDFKKSF